VAPKFLNLLGLKESNNNNEAYTRLGDSILPMVKLGHEESGQSF